MYRATLQTSFQRTRTFPSQVTLTDNTIPLLVNLRESVRTLLCEPAPPHQGGAFAPSKDPPSHEFEVLRTPNAHPDSWSPFQTGGSARPSGLPPLGSPGPESGFGTNQGLGINDSDNVIEGPDPIRRAHLIQNRPQSPTAAFNGLSFRSPPLGPQPFVSLKTPPSETRRMPPPIAKNLVYGGFDSNWDSWYTIPGGWSDDSSVSEVGVAGVDVNRPLGDGVNGDGQGGVNGGASLVRVRHLEWGDDVVALTGGQVRPTETVSASKGCCVASQ